MLQMKVVGSASQHWHESLDLVSQAYQKAFNAKVENRHENYIAYCRNSLIDENLTDADKALLKEITNFSFVHAHYLG